MTMKREGWGGGRSALLRTSMMTPMERRAGRFLRAPDHDASTGDAAAAETPAAETILFPADDAAAADPAAGDDAAKDGDRADPADVVPEDGKYALTMPEGVEVDQALLDELGPEFKELGLTNSQAQKLADKFIASQQAKAEAQGTRWSETITKWADDAKADKEIGGDKWDVTVAASQRAVKNLGTPELREYLNASGGGNHPELIRFMAKVGAMIKEDSPAGSGSEGSGKPADPAHLLFPSDAPKG